MATLDELLNEQQAHLTALQQITDELRTFAPPTPEPPPDGVIVTNPEELIAALVTGGTIQVWPGEYVHAGGFVIGAPTCLVAPEGATLRATSAPAIRVTPGTCDVDIEGVTCLSEYDGAVVQLGDNTATTQGTPEAVPRRISIRRITIPTHRGKRGIEVNAGDVEIIECTIADIYSEAGSDSQAICILNAPGPVLVDGGSYAAASECIMLGGDSMKVPGQVIADVTIRNAHLYKPLTWQTDGVKRGVKNLFEIKAGVGVTLERCTLDGSWKDAQDGWAIVITPRNSQYIDNVTIAECEITNAGGGIQLLGTDNATETPHPTSHIAVRDSRFTVSKSQFGGRGILALFVTGVLEVTVDNVTFEGDGNCILSADSPVVQGPCLVTGGSLMHRDYGVMMPGSNFGDPIAPESEYYDRRLIVDFHGATVSGAHSRFQSNFPDNTYI